MLQPSASDLEQRFTRDSTDEDQRDQRPISVPNIDLQTLISRLIQFQKVSSRLPKTTTRTTNNVTIGSRSKNPSIVINRHIHIYNRPAEASIDKEQTLSEVKQQKAITSELSRANSIEDSSSSSQLTNEILTVRLP